MLVSILSMWYMYPRVVITTVNELLPDEPHNSKFHATTLAGHVEKYDILCTVVKLNHNLKRH